MHLATTFTILIPALTAFLIANVNANPIATPTYTKRDEAAKAIISLIAHKEGASALHGPQPTPPPLQTQSAYVGVESLSGGAMETFTAAAMVKDAHGEKNLFSGHGDGFL